MSEMQVRLIENITKVYPDMIKVTIYKTPRLCFYQKHPEKRPRELVERDYEPLYSSLWRTRSTISDIVLCNDFEWFITFTFDPDKVDSFSYQACLNKINRWIHNQRINSPDLKYLIVPEQHKSGRWHFHGVFSQFKGSMRPSGHKSSSGRPVYNVTCFRSGFTTAVAIDNREAVSHYITKYITKDLIKQFNRRRFISSKNLTRPQKEINSKTFYLTPPLFKHRYFESDTYDCFSIDTF